MDVILYDPKDPARLPPHACVIDAQSNRGFEYTTFEEREQRENEHRADVGTGTKRYIGWPCAACDWNSPDVRKARASKKAKLERFLRTGKLPPLKKTTLGGSRIPRPLTDAEAARVVLPLPPHLFGRLRLDPQDKMTTWVCTNYLRAMGEALTDEQRTRRYNSGDTYTREWSCGCKTSGTEWAENCEPCEKHRRAFEGTGED